MFGVIQPCRHSLTPELRAEWQAHLCGLCCSLRDRHGHLARATTNVDAVVLSVLVEAQRLAPPVRVDAGRCPLRGMRSARIVPAEDPAAVHAAAVSLTMASIKLDDHALDGDGVPGRFPGTSRAVARRWAAAGAVSAAGVAFDAGSLHDAVAVSVRAERRRDAGFDAHVAPTEMAAAEAAAHTAVVAGRPENVSPLRTVGAMLGRITYLLDAVDDEAEDIAAGRFNALVAAYPDADRRRPAAAALFDEAHTRLIAALDDVAFERPELARALLVDHLARAGRQRFGHRRGDRCSTHGRAGAARAGAGAVGVLTRLAVLVGLSFPGFQPGVGPGGELPPMGLGGMPPGALPPEGKPRRGWCDGCGDGCCCDCCDCCDGCDGCDGCDCGCDC